MDNMVDMPEYETLVDIEPIQKMPVAQLMDIPAPVSYTHLDVYKRQAEWKGKP